MLHPRSNSTTLGAASAKVLMPPAHDDGIADERVPYAAQSARGTDVPIQLRRDCDPGNPVETRADDRRVAGVSPRNSPMPPRKTPGVVPEKFPSGLPICVFRIWPVRL